jgi:hypothetical protein
MFGLPGSCGLLDRGGLEGVAALLIRRRAAVKLLLEVTLD